MLGNPQIIHLYDKPRLRRPCIRRSAPSSGAGPAVLACTAIVVGVAMFFWVYDATVHREPSLAHPLARDVAAGPRSAAAATILVPPDAPAPDLNSPAVLLANADVPPAPVEPPGAAAKAPESAAPGPVRKAKGPPKKKRVQAAKRLPPDAARSYASEPGFFRVPFGGF